jgi:hypothetical protein
MYCGPAIEQASSRAFLFIYIGEMIVNDVCTIEVICKRTKNYSLCFFFTCHRLVHF